MDPLKLNSDIWKHILFSKVFGKVGLADEIVGLAKKICIKDNPNGYINTFEACHPVPLIKEVTGVRPVGIGEILTSVSKLLRKDILNASGTVQT